MTGTFIYQKDGAYAGFNMEHFSEFRWILIPSKDPENPFVNLEVHLNYNATKRFYEKKNNQKIYTEKTLQPSHLITNGNDIERFMNCIIEGNFPNNNLNNQELVDILHKKNKVDKLQDDGNKNSAQENKS